MDDSDTDKCHLTALPNELLSEIATYLPEHDRLKLRMVLPKSFEEVVLDMFGDKFKRLYLFPTEASLRRFVDISKSKFYQNNVTEVVFVLQSLLQDRPTPASHWCFAKWYYLDYHMPGQEYQGLEEEHEQGAMAAKSYQEYLQLTEEFCRRTSGGPYNSISEALALLPKLEKAKVCEGLQISEAGINRSTSWAATAGKRTPEASSTAAVAFVRHKHHKPNVQDCYLWMSSFLPALKNTRIQVLQLGDVLTGQLHFHLTQKLVETRHLSELMALDKSIMALRNLRSFTVSCMDSGLTTQAFHQHSIWKHMAGAVKSIEALTIQLAQRPEVRWCRQEFGRRVVDELLCFGEFPNLKQLKIIGRRIRPGLVKIPVLHAFLLRHKQSLEKVLLNGVLLVEGGDDHQVTQSIKTALSDIRDEMESLQTFEMRVHRRDDHGPRCPCPFVPGEPSWECQAYLIGKNNWVDRSCFDKLAEDLGVVLKNGEWNFAEF